MPTFCRHNRFLQNCPICARERAAELHDVVSPGRGAASRPPRRPTRPAPTMPRSRDVRVRRLTRGVEDGFHSPLVPGLKSSLDAERLAQELAFAEHRLCVLSEAPPGLYAEVAGDGDLEERTWLAFLIAYLGPLDGEDPFTAIRSCRTVWASGALPRLDAVTTGPRGAHEQAHGTRTLEAYREWAGRSGSQAAAFTGDPNWSPERRFARTYERLALPGLHRDARFDLLLTLGRLGTFGVCPGALALGGANEVTLAAKRALGIGDPLLLERRAAELANACGLPLEALDAGLFNWGRGARATLGLGMDAEPAVAVLEGIRAALGL